MKKKISYLIGLLCLLLTSCNKSNSPLVEFASFYNDPNIVILNGSNVHFIDHTLELELLLPDDKVYIKSIYIHNGKVRFSTSRKIDGIYHLRFYQCDYYGNDLTLVDDYQSFRYISLETTINKYNYYASDQLVVSLSKPFNHKNVLLVEKNKRSLKFTCRDGEILINKEELEKSDFGSILVKYDFSFIDYSVYNDIIMIGTKIDYGFNTFCICIFTYEISSERFNFGCLRGDSYYGDLTYIGG